MVSLFIYLIKRFVKRILWKCFPKTDAYCLNIIKKYHSDNLYPKVYSIDVTIEKLINGKKSIARYGDGEFTLCFDRSIGFQRADRTLRKRLRTILLSQSDECIVAIQEFKIESVSSFWIHYWYENYSAILKLFRKEAIYYNQSITRECSIEQLTKLKRLWEQRYVVFVCGKGSRFDSTHEIFAGITGSTVVYGLAQHAFNEYAELLERTMYELIKYDNPLVIIALGPTATVLAFDLSQKGYQALDIGHITNIYDTLIYGKAKPEELPIYNS
jgi:hypothetical protein